MMRRFIFAMAGLAVLWSFLNEGETASWIVGVPAALGGAGLVCLLPAPGKVALSFRGVLGFVPYFAVHTVQGAWDVALRALQPGRQVEPGYIYYLVQLPPGPARAVFLNSVTLLPGTLTADLEDDLARIHVVDVREPNLRALKTLERRVARLFDCVPAT